MDEIKIGAHEIYLAPENITLEKAEKENNELSEVIKNEDIALKGEAEPKENIHKKEIVDLRKGNCKVYRMADGTEQAVIYSKAVHAFNEETKEFDEVDNTLVEDSEHKHLINSKNGFIAKFSQEETNDELFSIENGMHRVTVLARKNKKQKNKGVKPNVRRKFDFSDIDVVNFSNIEAATDYEYSVEADGVKENIVVKEKATAYRYPFVLKCENVIAKFDEQNKRIAFLSKEDGNEVFYIPAPFMTDANGATSSAVSYEMRHAIEDDVYLTVKADGGWLNDENRAFPVVIDPQIRLSSDTPIITYGWTDGQIWNGMTHTVGTVACDIKTDVGTGAPNESFACCAKEICVGDWMQDSITRSGETVCYRFETKAGTGNYTIATHGSLDTVGVLYDAFGHIITRGDDERKPNFAMTATLKGGEIYYFTVRAFSSKTGNYDVGVVYEGAISDRYENNRLYMNLEMPSLPNNPRIKKAELKFFQHSSSYLQASCNKLGLYHVTEEIGSENFTDEFAENLIDFALMKPGSSENNAEICYSFDITSLMDAFIKNEITSHNLVLKTIGECTACESNVVLYGSEYGGRYAPQIVVTYESTYGVNTSYRTHTHELGKFGQGSIDLQCGNLMLESEDFAWGGNRMPVTIKHLYNSALSDYNYTANSSIKLDTAYFGSMKLGKGFKLNVMQSIVKKGDEYVYISENGDATYLKESKETVCCDSNTQCYPLYKPEEDSDMSYDYVKRILKQGEEAYQFDASGRLISITEGNNKMLINYSGGQISSVVDGAGRIFDFDYSNNRLTRITAPDNSAITYTYNGDLLSSVTYPDGTKAVITYLLNKPKEIILSDSNNNPVYKVEYTFNGERLESVTEYGAQDVEFVMGSSSRYSYSAASGRTVVETTEQADGDEAENNVIKTVYTFDDDGNVVSEYVYSEDKGNVGANGEESGINPHSGDGGAGVVSNINNLLVGHNFEKLTAWPSMACNCGDISIYNYTVASKTKFGKRPLEIETNTACAENGVYQVTNVLPAGEYTFSAYVRPTTNITGAEQNGAYIRVTKTDGTVLGISEFVAEKDSEYIRLVAPFELSTEQSVIVQLLVNGKGTVYFNAPQLENNPFANAYNMLENGNFELDTAWNKNGAYYNSITRFNMNKAMSIIGNLDKKCYAYQKVYVKTNADTRETFTLSGWAKGWGLPAHAHDGGCKPIFRLRAVIKYSNGESDEYFADFSPCTEDWQLASVQFAKSQRRTVQYIDIFCEYDYNSGIAYFDDIQLIRNSIETGLSDSDFEDATEDADTDTTNTDNTETAAETATTEDDNGFKELTDKYGNTLTETTFTDGEFGTIYRAFMFNEDLDQSGNAGNDLISETDARGNVTEYTVDEDTSRNEEVIDRCGNKTAYEYDASGRTTKVTSLKQKLDENGNVLTDTNGEKVYEEIANVSYAYDLFDNLTQIVRGDGLEYALKYNAFHNLESIGIKDKNDGDLIKYTYKNGNGRLKEMTYANGDKMTATYNGIGQMIAEKWFDKNNYLTAYYKYVYDGQGNIVRSIDILARKEYNYLYEDGKIMQSTESAIVLDECTNMVISKTAVCTVRYYYDNEDGLVKKHIKFADGKELTENYEKTENDSQVVKFTAGGKVVTAHSKNDSFGRKVFDELQLSTGFVSRQFTYLTGEVTQEHVDNNMLKSSPTTQLVSQIVLSGGRTISYEYDEEERITKVDDSVDGITEYTYDALGQLVTETKDSITTKFEYDNYGNILAKGVVDENGEISEATKITYEYGNEKWKDLLTSYNGQEIVYDEQGNPVNYLGHTLTWEKGRQLKSFDNIQYTYNANGIRTSKTVDGIRHDFVLDGAKILRETWEVDEVVNSIVPLYDNEDSVCGIEFNGTAYYFLKNLQGDIIAITDSSGEEVARYSYDAWGVCTVTQDISNCDIANINPFRYRGYFYDLGTDLYYLQSRYYDAQVGRFVNGDMAEFATIRQSVLEHNLFTYCVNDIINVCDFTGYAVTTIRANGSFESKYEKQITNSVMYKKNKGIFLFKNKKNVSGWISKKFSNGFYYSYGFYDSGSLISQKGFRFTTYYFLTKKVSEWKKCITTYDFSWIIKAMKIASFAMQVYSGTAYANNGDAWMLLGETTDRVLEKYGDIFSNNLKGIVIDSMSRYISSQISGKKANQKVSILMFAKTTCHLKRIFSKKWDTKDSFYGYPWEKKHYFIR